MRRQAMRYACGLVVRRAFRSRTHYASAQLRTKELISAISQQFEVSRLRSKCFLTANPLHANRNTKQSVRAAVLK